MKLIDLSLSVFSYFCIGFTVVVLTAWTLGRPLDIPLAIFVGAALAAGRFTRVIVMKREARELPGTVSNG